MYMQQILNSKLFYQMYIHFININWFLLPVFSKSSIKEVLLSDWVFP